MFYVILQLRGIQQRERESSGSFVNDFISLITQTPNVSQFTDTRRHSYARDTQQISRATHKSNKRVRAASAIRMKFPKQFPNANMQPQQAPQIRFYWALSTGTRRNIADDSNLLVRPDYV